MTALLELDDVNVWFEREEGGELHAVQGVSLAIEPGERLGLVGAPAAECERLRERADRRRRRARRR